MYQALIILHVLVGLTIIGLVLIQRGRGADAGAGFGGSSNTLFGARGAATFLSKTTAIMAAFFFTTSLALAYLSGKHDNAPADLMDAPAQPAPQSDLPPVPAPAGPSGEPSDLPQQQDLPPAESGAPQL